MSTLGYALEKLCDYAEAETKDRRPRDKHGPIGRKPIASIPVGDLRGLLMLHTDPRDEATVKAEALEELAVEFDKQAAEWDTPMPIPEGWDSHHIIVRGATQNALVNAAKAARKAAEATS